MADPNNVLPLLRCTLCELTLKSPTTLLCGHSLCSHHAPVCPTCTPTPAPSPAQADVTLTAIVSLVSRTAERLKDPLRPPDEDEDDDPDDDGPSPSTSARDSAPPRPRKRHKRSHEQDDDLLDHLRSAAARDRLVPPDEPLIPPSDPSPQTTILAQFDEKLLEELTCHICYVLFYNPVTTPCQHTFCAKCLQRSLDHSTTCPICRNELPSSYFQDQPVNKTLMSIILQAYPLLYKERGEAIQEDERHARLSTPIFVCQLSFPGVPTILHFFEPRYRLMLRRCLESPNPRFGMIMSPKPGAPQTDYGTMLEIRSVQMLPDGRSIVETWGSTRFRILEKGTLDGYMVGRIERIEDYPDDLTETLVFPDEPTPRQDRTLLRRIADTLTRPSTSSNQAPSANGNSEESATESPPSSPSAETAIPRPRPPTNEELMNTCKAFLDTLQRGAAPWVVQRLSSTYGPMPTDPSLFAFWVALVLPLEEHEKAKLLPIRSARLRLMLVVHWIEQLNNNWYAWLSFVVWHGWIVDGPAALCLLWVALVLTFFRFVGWV